MACVGERSQFFDLEFDPDECIDLALNPSYSSKIAEYRKLLGTIVDEDKVDREAREAQCKAMEEMGDLKTS